MANNDCGSSPTQTKAIIVSNTPVTPGTIAGSATMCEGTTQTYSISLVSGASGYTWTVPVGTTINSGQGTNSISVTIGYASGNIEVTANNSCGTSAASSYPITVTPLPYAFFSWSSTGLAVTFTNLSLNGSTYAWVFGDAGTSSAPSPVHNYAAPGTYTVELTVTNACGTGYYTTNITITSTGNGGDVGIEETQQSLNLNIYPNPTNGKFKISIEGETVQYQQKYNLEIYNLFGQIVHQTIIQNQDSEIDLSNFSNGIYYVKCISENGAGMVKIVKQ
jgi:PKD repeat protein